MTLIITEKNANKVVGIFLSKVSNCPEFFSVWDFLALNPSKIPGCISALSALIETMILYEKNPEFNQGVLTPMSDAVIRLAKLQMKVGK